MFYLPFSGLTNNIAAILTIIAGLVNEHRICGQTVLSIKVVVVPAHLYLLFQLSRIMEINRGNYLGQ